MAGRVYRLVAMMECNMIDCRFCKDGKCTATSAEGRQGRRDNEQGSTDRKADT